VGDPFTLLSTPLNPHNSAPYSAEIIASGYSYDVDEGTPDPRLGHLDPGSGDFNGEYGSEAQTIYALAEACIVMLKKYGVEAGTDLTNGESVLGTTAVSMTTGTEAMTVDNGATINNGAIINDGATINAGVTVNDGSTLNDGCDILGGGTSDTMDVG